MVEKLKPHILSLMLLILVTVVVYGQTFGHEFLSNWDDNVYITENMAIQGITPEHLKLAFTRTFLGNYAPVQIISYMLDYSVGGMRPAGFHVTNLFLHIINGLLFYLFVFRLCGSRVWALSASALFLLHPLQVESVAWLSQRKNLLAMFFFLLSVLAYHEYRERPPGRRAYLYMMAFALFMLALLAKSVAVILPLVLLLMDRCCESSHGRNRFWLDKLPFLLAAVAVAAVTILVQAPEMSGGRSGFHGDSPLATFFTMLTVLVRYLWLLVWPLHLSPLYLPPLKQAVDLQVAMAMLLVAGLLAAGFFLWRRDRLVFFGYALFFTGLLPVSQIVPLVTLMNDRYLYFPMLGVAWVAGGALCRLLDTHRQWQRPLGVGIYVLIISGFATISCQRTTVWKNSVTLWSDAVSKLPDSWEARAALAEAQLNAGMADEALLTYTELFQLPSDSVDPGLERKALNNAAVLHMNSGRNELALPLLQRLVAKFPDYPPGFINLGNLFRLAKNLPAAERAYRAVLGIEPGNTVALTSLGTTLLEIGKPESAREILNQAVTRGIKTAELQFALACLEGSDGKVVPALQYLEEALQLGFRDRVAIASNPALAAVRQSSSYNQLLTTYFMDIIQ